MSDPTLQALRARVSVRNYSELPVDDDLVELIVEAAFQAPTSDNAQACSVVRITDGTVRTELFDIGGRQRHILDAPVFLVVCADLARIADAVAASGAEFDDSSFDATVVATIDAALVGMSVAVAASSVGLGTVMVGAMRNDPDGVAELLELPPRVIALFGIGLGWPADRSSPSSRLALTGKYFQNRYDVAAARRAIDAYDRETAERTGIAWSASLAAVFARGRSRRAGFADAARRRGLCVGPTPADR